MDRSYEEKWQRAGYPLVAGVDEVGRGPLAGPVVTCAVIMGDGEMIPGVNDSKKLSAKKRERLVPLILKQAIAYRIEAVSHEVIDEINILQATRLAMKRAIEGLEVKPSCVLTDGNMTLDVSLPQESIVGGDAKSYTIACASILAKVYRDDLMKEYAKQYPGYCFERNAWFGTAGHGAAIRE
ncbi:MAG: ribonuclease HII, partial [Christensenellaceae bacterium]